MEIIYQLEPNLTTLEFQEILISSTLAARRPVNDLARLDQMLRGADIVCTARSAGKLVGISRAITDFAFCGYLSDLAVAVEFQKQGIGRRLIMETHQAAGLHTSLFLVSAPAALEYYPKIQMQSYPCFGIPAEKLAEKSLITPG